MIACRIALVKSQKQLDYDFFRGIDHLDQMDRNVFSEYLDTTVTSNLVDQMCAALGLAYSRPASRLPVQQLDCLPDSSPSVSKETHRQSGAPSE